MVATDPTPAALPSAAAPTPTGIPNPQLPVRVHMPNQGPAPAFQVTAVPGQSLDDMMALMMGGTVDNHQEPEHKVCRRLAAEKKKQAIVMVRASAGSADPAANQKAIQMVREANELETRASQLVLRLADPPNLNSPNRRRPSRECVDCMPVLSEEASPTARRATPPEGAASGSSVPRSVPLSDRLPP